MSTDHFPPASRITSASANWLWPGWLALGKLCLFDGDPGLGKSLFALDLCARITTARPMPDGALPCLPVSVSPCPEISDSPRLPFSPSPILPTPDSSPLTTHTSPLTTPANVIVVNGEDAARDTIIPRLTTLGADLDRVFIYQPDDATPFFGLPKNLPLLDEALERIKPRLIVIDPIMAFLDQSVSVMNDQSVRRLFAPLARRADKNQTAILMIRHLNKHAGQSAVYRGGGSIGMIAACRSAWLISHDPTPTYDFNSKEVSDTAPQPDPLTTHDSPLTPQPHPPDPPQSRLILAQLKNNLSPPQPSLMLEICNHDGTPPTIHARGQCAWTAADLLGSSRSGRNADQHDRACAWLQHQLKDGPRPSRDIEVLALKDGITEITLKRARKRLKTKSALIRHASGQRWYVMLRDQTSPRPENDPDSLEPWYKKIREKFPPKTILDEDD